MTIVVERRSSLTGKLHIMELDVTEEEIHNYNEGMLIQQAFPRLSAAEREFLKTGITPEEWHQVFPPEEEAP